MRSPIDTIQGRIVDYNPETEEVTIKAKYPDWPVMLRREYRDCNIQLIDGRPLSDKQRRTCYKLIREISNYTGMGLDPTKEWTKIKFLTEDLQETADKIFSLSNAPMSLVCAYQQFLVNFILDWEIPCSFSLLDFVDNVSAYIYACLEHKKCCVCGQHCDLHHVDRVGMGGNRVTMIHEGMEVLPLCRGHHTECHDIGQKEFEEAYHIPKGIILDKHLCKIYRLKAKTEEEPDYAQPYHDNGPPDQRP